MSILKLSTPGVYVQEIPTFPPSVAEVETAIPAFIGYTEKATKLGADITLIPTKINNFDEYSLFFGGAQEESEDSITIGVTNAGSDNYSIEVLPVSGKKSVHNMYYAVKHFFDNGGGVCYIASVGPYTPLPGSPDKTILINGLNTIKDVDEVTILVIPETQYCNDYKSVVQTMITQAADLKDRFALIDPDVVTPKNSLNPSGDIGNDASAIRNCTVGAESDRYAAAYYPNLITTYSQNFNIDDLLIDSYAWTGSGTDPNPLTPGTTKMSDIGSGSILYSKIKDEVNKQYVELPPSAAIAGIYARVDENKGVWKAPANESVLSVVGPSIPISHREQMDLNIDSTSGKSINAIRTFPGYGTLVWGARTLNGNDNEWRYISVRRFFNMVEESVKKSCQVFVFDPNTIGTWVKVQAMIENYLFLKWREGALAGSKPEQAYYVRVGLGTTMTSLDILEGRMNVEIGMAVARPAEFIVLKFSQMMQQS
jgi:phage tail sheath protein FI